MKNEVTVRAVCDCCDGTGLYEGMCERPGEPLVCLGCKGSGWSNITYIPFKSRKVVRGIKCVRFSRGSFIMSGVGGEPVTAMTYAEFLKRCPENR